MTWRRSWSGRAGGEKSGTALSGPSARGGGADGLVSMRVACYLSRLNEASALDKRTNELERINEKSGSISPAPVRLRFRFLGAAIAPPGACHPSSFWYRQSCAFHQIESRPGCVRCHPFSCGGLVFAEPDARRRYRGGATIGRRLDAGA